MISRLGLWFSVVGALLGACSSVSSVPGNLLDGKAPLSAAGVEHPERMTDARVPSEGDPWNTNITSVWQPAANVVFDLGRSTPLDAAAIVGDNNDGFDFAVSDDNATWRPLWSVGGVAGAGMRLREVSGLGAVGRYVRLTVRGGDPFVSVGEVLLFAQRPPLPLVRSQGAGPLADAERYVYGFGGAIAGFLLLLLVPGLARSAALAAGAVALLTAGWCAWQLFPLWPLPWELVSLLRAVIALVAGVALLCWTLTPRLRTGPIKVTLAALALLSLACFFNLGKPWFRSAAADRATLVHTFDMRVYFPVAKYFHELRYDGVYLASVAAYTEAEHVAPSSIGHVELRDLTNNQMLRVRDVLQPIEQVKQRFSAPRWREFVQDMRYFWKTMGPGDYLNSLRDHGGNATPVWLAIAHLLFAGAQANEWNLTLTGLLDPLLLVLLFTCIGRSFGLRAMLVCAVVFGATDFPMFGSNWWGATLRFDWMVSAGLAACALKTRRFTLAGALLAYAGLARAFPAAALLFTVVPFAVYVVERVLQANRPGLSELRAHSASLASVLLGAAVTALLLVSLSGALLGFEQGWGGWLDKIAIHTEKANLNHVGLRTILGFDPDNTADKLLQSGAAEPWARWEALQRETFAQRAPWVWALRGLFVVLCVLACRGASLERAALVGLTLIPVLLYPANYYCHYVFLLPLLAVGLPPMAAMFLEATLLGMCALQYLTLFGPGDVRFYWESVQLIASLFLLLLPLVYDALRDRFGARVPEASRSRELEPAYAAALLGRALVAQPVDSERVG